MNFFSYTINSFFETGMIKNAHMSIREPYVTTVFESLQVIGVVNKSNMIITALEWIRTISPKQWQMIEKHVLTIVVAGNVRKNIVCPIKQTLIFDGKWVEMVETITIGQNLANAAWYISDCCTKRRYIMKAENLRGSKGQGTSLEAS